jgi:hypothetical protein
MAKKKGGETGGYEGMRAKQKALEAQARADIAAEKSAERAAKAEEKALDRAKERLNEAKLTLEVQKQILKQFGDTLDARQTEALVAKKIYDTAVEELALLDKTNDAHAELIVKATELRDKNKEAADEAKKMADAWGQAKKDTDHLLNTFFGMNAESKRMGKALKNFPEYAKQLGKELKEGLSYTNMMGAAATKAQEIFRSMGKTISDSYGLSKPKELAERYYDESRKIARQVNVMTTDELTTFQTRTSAIAANTRYTREEIEKTYQGLFKASTAFRQASAKDQDTIRTLGMTLERRLGVPAEASTKAIEELTLAFGKSQPEAQKLTANLALLGKTLKIGPGKLMADFAANSSTLAKFGLPDVTEEFGRLAEVQAKSGVAMGTLMTSMEKWTTFEGALTAASNLNAVFGTTIDGLEIMDTTINEGPLKGFIKLRQGMEEAGESIETMGLPRLRALGKSFGMGAHEMKKLASVSTATLDDIANKPADAYMSLSDVMAKVKKDEEDMEGLGESRGKMQDSQAEKMKTGIEMWIKTQKSMDKAAESMGLIASAMGSVTGGLVSVIGQMASFALMAAVMSGGSGFMKLAGAIGIAAGAYGVYSAATDGDSGAGSILKGAGSGALAGASIGAMIPIPGAALIGGAIGAVGGGIAGAFDGGQEVVSQDGLKYVHAGEKIVSQNTVNRELAKAGDSTTNVSMAVNLTDADGKTRQHTFTKSFRGSDAMAAFDEAISLTT